MYINLNRASSEQLKELDNYQDMTRFIDHPRLATLGSLRTAITKGEQLICLLEARDRKRRLWHAHQAASSVRVALSVHAYVQVMYHVEMNGRYNVDVATSAIFDGSCTYVFFNNSDQASY